jgi:hypothetical protein
MDRLTNGRINTNQTSIMTTNELRMMAMNARLVTGPA